MLNYTTATFSAQIDVPTIPHLLRPNPYSVERIVYWNSADSMESWRWNCVIHQASPNYTSLEYRYNVHGILLATTPI